MTRRPMFDALRRESDRLLRLATDFRASLRGNVALITALCAPVLCAVLGFSLDYAYSSYIHRSLNKATEAAVLAAVSQTAATSGGGYANTPWLQSYGVTVFKGNVAGLPVTGVTPTLTVTPNGTGGVVADATYTYAVPTFFSGFFGMSTMPIKGHATATANPATYINYYIIVDISQSMGIAATPADMSALYARTTSAGNGGCVFACHVTTGGQTQTNEYLAHAISPKITLRIDSAVAAIQNIIDDAQAATGSTPTIKIGLYTMSDDPVSGKKINVVSAPTYDYTGLKALALGIDLGGNTAAGIGDTNFPAQLPLFSALVGVNGTGVSAISPINYAFIVTDGVRDTPGSCTSGHCTSAFDSTLCAPLKLKATVGMIYTTYLPIYNQNDSTKGYDGNYQALVLPFTNAIAPALQACATSTQFYYEASDGPAINTAMKALFASTLKTARLSQ